MVVRFPKTRIATRVRLDLESQAFRLLAQWAQWAQLPIAHGRHLASNARPDKSLPRISPRHRPGFGSCLRTIPGVLLVLGLA